MSDPKGPLSDEQAALPGNLRFLRILVTTLTAVMIGGVLAIVALLVIRLSAESPVVPETLVLPDGTEATAFTMAPDWMAVVTADNRILIYDRASGSLTQEIEITSGGDN